MAPSPALKMIEPLADIRHRSFWEISESPEIDAYHINNCVKVIRFRRYAVSGLKSSLCHWTIVRQYTASHLIKNLCYFAYESREYVTTLGFMSPHHGDNASECTRRAFALHDNDETVTHVWFSKYCSTVSRHRYSDRFLTWWG